MANKTLNNVKINVTLKSTNTRAQLSTSSEDLAVQMGKINKWYDSLVPTGGATGNILGWNSDGTAKWVTVAPSADKLNVASAVGGTTQPVYFKADGTPEAISFTIGKSVPANAVFTDQNVKSTLLAQSTAEASYRPTFVTGATTGGVYIIDSYKVNHTPGTTGVVGNTRLVLGNATASGTANNEEGQIKLYSPGTAFHTIKGTTVSSETIHVLPTTGGNILNDGTTGYTQTVSSSATGAYEIGKIKINNTTTTIYGKDTNTTYTLGTSGDNVTLTPSSGTVQSITVPYATKANLLKYTHTNEINISGGKQSTCYINYRDADTDAQDEGETPVSMNYKFCNYRNSTANTTITAANFSGNASTATKWKTARTLTIGSTGKSVDGSGNQSWSLAEIGALSSSTTYALSTSVGGNAILADGLAMKTLTAETLDTTTGSFVFKGTNLLGAVYDWVGFQADAGNDRFQIVANSQLMFRQNDGASITATWGDWVGCLTPNNVSAASGIKVTATTTTIGTGTTAFTYNSGVKIEHDVTTSDDTTDSGSLSHGGTFTAITSVTRDSYGHVTTLNTKTYILPASGNTDTKVNVTLGTTTKAYLLGTSTTPTSSAQAVTSIADTGVYLDTTAGMLTANTFKGGLYSYNPATDQTATNGYPTYTVAYFQTSGAFGGTVGRTGNSRNNYWAHYLTFTHSDRNYRYLLRFPFWGPPQYQHTNDGGNKRWCSFITDEHAGNYSKYMGTGTAIDPITGAMHCTHRANKLAFLPAANITVQTSTDSGSTWTDLSVSDDLKRKIFSLPVRNSGINIGPSSGNTTTSMQTRIIIECDGRDAVLNRFMFEIGSNHQNIAIDVYAGTTISGLTKISTGDSSSTWAYEAVVTIDHNPDKYYRFSTSNYKYIAFVFRYTYVDSNYPTERGTINGISGYSGNYWGNNCKSNLAHFDHLYSWDIDQNALFPATVQGEKLAIKSGTYTTTIEKGSTSADRTLVLPDASGGIGVANILFNTPTNSTNPIPVSGSLSDYDYFTIVIGMNGSNAEQTSSAIVPAVAGSHFFLFQILESVGSGGSMMFPAGVVITTTSSTISFSLGVNRGINIPSSGTSTSVIASRTAYIKMIIGHKS